MIINYFPHDSNARSDNKIIALRMKHGWEGYGLFWALVEKLRDSTDYRLATDFDALAYDLRTEAETVRSIVSDFGLFTTGDGQFHSDSLLRRMEIKDDRSARSREAALARWRKPSCEGNASAMPVQEGGNADAEQEKKIKLQKSKGISLSAQPVDTAAQREERERLVFEIFLRERGLPTARDETIRFFDYYDSRGWQSGATPITDAGAAARLWEPRPKPSPLPAAAAATLRTLYDVLCREPGFTWREFRVSGGRHDPLSQKLLLSCTKSFGAHVKPLREPLFEAVTAAGGTGFRLLYNQDQ